MHEYGLVGEIHRCCGDVCRRHHGTVAILIAAVASIASQALVALAGGGFVVFLAGAALHDHNIDRESPVDNDGRERRSEDEV